MAEIKKVGVLSVAKINGLIGVVMGLIMGIIYALVGTLMIAFASTKGSGILAGLGFTAIIIMPIIYGLIGFVGGAVGAWLYNLFAGLVGGIEIELKK